MSATKILWGQITIVFLAEDLHAKERKHRLLMMLDEFPALGRLDFFESALAFMAGYGIKSFLIAQSLNQIEKAYGANNSILDNCHVRVSFATNDERTAKRVSDALGTATEMKAMKNYAGHRLSPWLGHLMVSRSETARPLLTPGEVMQLPPTDEIVMVAGTRPIRARKVRYYEDAQFKERLLSPPDPQKSGRTSRADGWSALTPQKPDAVLLAEMETAESDQANSGLRREPELPDHVAIAQETTDQKPAEEFAIMLDEQPEDAVRQRQALRRQMRGLARQVSLDPNDGMEL
jgi:type IV secretion system protein VirD4